MDKKRSATFRSMSRDPSADDGGAHGGDRVFVRVGKNPFSVVGNLEEDAGNDAGDDDPMLMIADAPGDCDDGGGSSDDGASSTSRLPDHIGREILELGFPDDGYNYLWHLREIRNAGGGSAFYQNSKAGFDLVPKDAKAYDALRVQVHKAEGDPHDKLICSVAANSVNVRVQKAIDPEVGALLDDSDISRFGSEVEDLEEDFVVQANHLEGEEGIVEQYSRMPEVMGRVINGSDAPAGQERQIDNGFPHEIRSRFAEQNDDFDDEKPQERRLLDEQFDLLERQEYGSEDIEDDSYGGYMAEEDESLALKLKQTFDDKVVDDLEIDDNYRVPADLLKENEVKSKQLQDFAADLIRCCVEYADKYENENDDKEVVIVEESSDESEVWDCETIVSTYSNLDNHPGKIEPPEVARKKKWAGIISVALGANPLIPLIGKEKLPIDYLPRSMKSSAEKIQGGSVSRNEQPRRKQHGQESKEENKEKRLP